MLYTTTINQNGMILLNKDARKALGVKLGDRVTIDVNNKGAKIAKRMTDEEAQAYMDSLFSPKTKRLIKKYAGMSASDLFDIAMTKAIEEEMAEGRL